MNHKTRSLLIGAIFFAFVLTLVTNSAVPQQEVQKVKIEQSNREMSEKNNIEQTHKDLNKIQKNVKKDQRLTTNKQGNQNQQAIVQRTKKGDKIDQSQKNNAVLNGQAPVANIQSTNILFNSDEMINIIDSSIQLQPISNYSIATQFTKGEDKFKQVLQILQAKLANPKIEADQSNKQTINEEDIQRLDEESQNIDKVADKAQSQPSANPYKKGQILPEQTSIQNIEWPTILFDKQQNIRIINSQTKLPLIKQYSITRHKQSRTRHRNRTRKGHNNKINKISNVSHAIPPTNVKEKMTLKEELDANDKTKIHIKQELEGILPISTKENDRSQSQQQPKFKQKIPQTASSEKSSKLNTQNKNEKSLQQTKEENEIKQANEYAKEVKADQIVLKNTQLTEQSSAPNVQSANILFSTAQTIVTKDSSIEIPLIRQYSIVKLEPLITQKNPQSSQNIETPKIIFEQQPHQIKTKPKKIKIPAINEYSIAPTFANPQTLLDPEARPKITQQTSSTIAQTKTQQKANHAEQSHTIEQYFQRPDTDENYLKKNSLIEQIKKELKKKSQQKLERDRIEKQKEREEQQARRISQEKQKLEQQKKKQEQLKKIQLELEQTAKKEELDRKKKLQNQRYNKKQEIQQREMEIGFNENIAKTKEVEQIRRRQRQKLKKQEEQADRRQDEIIKRQNQLKALKAAEYKQITPVQDLKYYAEQLAEKPKELSPAIIENKQIQTKNSKEQLLQKQTRDSNNKEKMQVQGAHKQRKEITKELQKLEQKEKNAKENQIESNKNRQKLPQPDKKQPEDKLKQAAEQTKRANLQLIENMNLKQELEKRIRDYQQYKKKRNNIEKKANQQLLENKRQKDNKIAASQILDKTIPEHPNEVNHQNKQARKSTQAKFDFDSDMELLKKYEQRKKQQLTKQKGQKIKKEASNVNNSLQDNITDVFFYLVFGILLLLILYLKFCTANEEKQASSPPPNQHGYGSLTSDEDLLD